MNENLIIELNAEGGDQNQNTSPECNHTYLNSIDETCELCGTVREVTNVDNFLYTLGLMGKGMLGIFMVTAVIIATIIALNKATSPKKKEAESSDQQ